MQIGYGRTGTSPELSAKFQYFRPDHDVELLSRDRLLPLAIDTVRRMKDSYVPPQPPTVQLASPQLIDKMDAFMADGVARGDFAPHNKVVAMQIATVIVARKDEARHSDEQALFDRERRAFLNLAKQTRPANGSLPC